MALGGAADKIFRIGEPPFDSQVGAYYNVARPNIIGPEWLIRAQIARLPNFKREGVRMEGSVTLSR